MEKNPTNESRESRAYETLRYAERLASDLSKAARETMAMIEEAKARGIDVNVENNDVLKKFEGRGENEIQLLNLLSDMRSIGSSLFEQGVRVTPEDMSERLRVMEQK